MAQFKPERIDLTKINNGNEWENGKSPTVDTFNAPIKASAFAQALATNQPKFVENGGEPNVSIEYLADGTPYLVFSNIGSDGGGLTGSEVNALIDTKLQNFSGGVTEERVNEIVDEKGFVKNTDFATKEKAGVVKVASPLRASNGTLGIDVANEWVIDTRAQRGVYNIFSPYYLDYGLKVGLTTNKYTLTEEEKKKAQNWLGANYQGEIDSIYSILGATVIGTEEVNISLCDASPINISGLIDGSYARVERVYGTTQYYGENQYLNAEFINLVTYADENKENEIDRLSLGGYYELGAYDYIDFEKGKIVRQTGYSEYEYYKLDTPTEETISIPKDKLKVVSGGVIDIENIDARNMGMYAIITCVVKRGGVTE